MRFVSCPHCPKVFYYNINGDAHRKLAENRLKKHISDEHEIK